MQQNNDLDEKKRKQMYQDCPRYGVQDPYTITELTRFYDRETSRGRIRVLRRVYSQGFRLPFELALRAVTDSDPSIREWMAREGKNLDYRHHYQKIPIHPLILTAI